MVMGASLPGRLGAGQHGPPERVQTRVMRGANRQHTVQLGEQRAALVDRHEVMHHQDARAFSAEQAAYAAAVTVAPKRGLA